MRSLKVRKEKLSIYLARDQFTLDADIIKIENAKQTISIQIPGAESATLYIKRDPPKNTPPWTRLFTSTNQVDADAFGTASSVGAVFSVHAHGKLFVLSFSTGFHLLKSVAIERDFGLKVTLNSVDPDKLRSLDKASYDHNPLNSRTQSTRDVDIFNLQVDAEMEMLYALTGASTVPEFGSHVTGRDALTLVVEVNLSGLSQLLGKALEKYKASLPERFQWVDNILRVRDFDTLSILDMELETRFQKMDIGNFWLGEPEIIDWEGQVGYSFDLRKNTVRHIILKIENYLDYRKGIPPTIEDLKSEEVIVNNSEFSAVSRWPVYNCIYAEVAYGGDQYILRNGNWYRVNTDFVLSIDQYLQDLNLCSYTFPMYNHDTEGEYNEYISNIDPRFSLMDKNLIKIGGRYDKIEHCDVIKDNFEFVHVKYYRSSSTLSHLFAQGQVSGEAFIGDIKYRERLNSKLPGPTKLSDPKLRPDPSKYKIIYAIATTKSVPSELPFFSKVTLKNALKGLRAFGYKIELAKIEVDPTVLVKTKCKPAKSKKL